MCLRRGRERSFRRTSWRSRTRSPPQSGSNGHRSSKRSSDEQVPPPHRHHLGCRILHRCLRPLRHRHGGRPRGGAVAPQHPSDQLGHRGGDLGRFRRCLHLRAHRRRDRPQEGLRHRGRDHDLRGGGFRLRPGLHIPGRRSVGTRLGHRRRLSRLGGVHERVLQPPGPGSTGRPGLFHAGVGFDRRTTDRPLAVVVGYRRRVDVAHPPRPRRNTGCRCRLLALQNARIASLPGPGAGRIGEGGAGPEAFSDGVIAQPTDSALASGRLQLRSFLSDPRMLKLILGTAGAWFLFDYAYYGNTLVVARHLERGQSDGVPRDQAVVVARACS